MSQDNLPFSVTQELLQEKRFSVLCQCASADNGLDESHPRRRKSM